MVWKTKIADSLSRAELFLEAFFPSLLTFISLGFFLRLGWILSFAGIQPLINVCLFATFISCITAFSISWMLSNQKNENNSLSLLLSRTFGVDVAFSISIPLFISQALSAAFYIIGLAEVVTYLFPIINLTCFLWFSFVILICITWIKSDYLLKSELLIFILLITTLITIFFNPFLSSVSWKAFTQQGGFWETFALFFPLITGVESILASCNNKKFSPKIFAWGVQLGIGVSLLFYLAMIYCLHRFLPLELIKADAMAMKNLSSLPSLFYITILCTGVFAAYNSLSSALQTLKNLLQDALHLSSSPGNTLSIVITFFVMGMGLFFGSLNTLSSFLSLFFLISYGMINMATGLEAWIGNPSWRPTLVGHSSLCFLGTLSCFLTLLMISPGFGLIAGSISLSLYFFIKQKKITTSWDDFRYSITLFIAKIFIYKLNHLLPSPKTWRPNLLVFIGDPLLRAHLMEISCDLTHKKGFLIFSSILLDANSCLYERKKLSLLLEKKGISALVTTKVAPSVIEGMRSLIDNIGLGSLSPNTIVAGASEKEEKIPFIAEMILFVYRSQKNLVLIKESSTTQSLRTSKTIHVWWGAQNRINSELMIIFSHMLKKSFSWKSAKIVLKTVVKNAEEVASMQKKLINFMDESRVFFDTSVILHQHGDVFTKTIQEHAAGADLVFLGLRAPESNETIENYAKYYKSLMEKTQEFPAVAFILAGEPLDFKKILF